MNLSRRRLFGLGAAIVAAPAIVRVSALMPISAPKLARYNWSELRVGIVVDSDFHKAYSRKYALVFYDAVEQMVKATALTPEGLGFINGKPPRIAHGAASWWKNTATA